MMMSPRRFRRGVAGPAAVALLTLGLLAVAPLFRACQGYCALIWPPVLTSGRPEAGPGVDQHALGVVARPDGTRQVTYKGKPLYLFIRDAYIPGIIGTQSINGAGAVTPWGVFNTIPLT